MADLPVTTADAVAPTQLATNPPPASPGATPGAAAATPTAPADAAAPFAPPASDSKVDLTAPFVRPASDKAAHMDVPFKAPASDQNINSQVGQNLIAQAKDMAASGASPQAIADFYVQNETVLAPHRQEITDAFTAAQKSPLNVGKGVSNAWESLKGVVNGATMAATGLGLGVENLFHHYLPQVFPATYQENSNLAQGMTPEKANELARKQTSAEAREGVELVAADTADIGRRLIKSAVQAESTAPIVSDIGAVAQAPGTKAPPTPEADLNVPEHFLNPKNPQDEFQSAVASSYVRNLITTGGGVLTKGTEVDPDMLASKYGVHLNSDIIDGYEQTGDLAVFAALTGPLKIVPKMGDFAIVNGAGRTVATSASESAAKAGVQAIGRGITTTADGLNKVVSTVSKAVTAPLKKLKEGGLAGVVGLGVLKEAGALDPILKLPPVAAITQYVGPVVAGAVTTKLAATYGLKAISGAGKLLSSDLGSSVAAAGTVGAVKGAAAMAPFAMTADNKTDAFSNLLFGGVAGGTVGGMVRGGLGAADALSRMDAYNHGAILDNFSPNKSARVTLNRPGMENFEKATQDNLDALGSRSTGVAANTLRGVLDARGVQSYVLTPEQATANGVPDIEGAHDYNVKDSTGATQKATIWVLRGNDIKSLAHEPGHDVVNFARGLNDGSFEKLINSIPDAERQRITARYMAGAAQSPEVMANLKADPDYMTKEIGAEVLGQYLKNGLSTKMPVGRVRSIGQFVGSMINRMGVRNSRVLPGAPGATAYGLIPDYNVERVAGGIVNKYLADPTVDTFLKGQATPPPATPAAPLEVKPLGTEPTVTPDHTAAIAAVGRVNPELANALGVVADKIKNKVPLTSQEGEAWRVLDDHLAALKPKTEGLTPEEVTARNELKTGQPEVKPAPPEGAQPGGVTVIPKEVPKARPQTTDEGRLEAGENIANAVKETGSKELAMMQGAGAHEVVYQHAEGEKAGQKQRSEVVNAPEARGRKGGEKLRSTLTLLDARKTKSSGWQGQFFNHDVLGQNMEVAVKAIKVAGLEARVPYKIGDRGIVGKADQEEFREDLRKYTENQHNGFKGDGGKLERPKGGRAYLPEETPGYVPQRLSDPRAAEFLNLLMGENPPKTTIVRPKGSYPVHLEHQDIARLNKGVVHPIAGLEYEDIKGRSVASTTNLRNDLRAAGHNLADMKPVHEWKNVNRIVSAKPIAGEATVAAPVTATTGAGFMPNAHPKAIKEAAMRDETTGKVYTGPMHVAATLKYLEETHPNQDFNELRAWEQLPNLTDGWVSNEGEFLTRQEGMERAEKYNHYNPDKEDLASRELESTRFNKQMGMAAMPRAGSPEVRTVAEDYADKAGLPKLPAATYAQVNPDLMKRIADHFEDTPTNLKDPDVQKSYQALATEVKTQYGALTKAGYKIEPWTGKGEPYASSADMVKDVQDNKHLYFLKTEGNFGKGAEPKDNPMLQPAGASAGDQPLVVNDLFCAVHDFFGHAKEGYQFGPRGEFNAWREHSAMFSPEAQGALAAETLAQNAWVNFGRHLRGPTGEVATKGEAGYVPPTERPFAEQKNIAIPANLRQEAASQAAFMGRAKQGASEKKLSGWVLPNSKFHPLVSGYHETDLQNNADDWNKQFGLTLPENAQNDNPARIAALNSGFVRIRNFTGNTSVELNPRFWAKQKSAILKKLLEHKDDLARLQVNFINDEGTPVDAVADNINLSKTKQADIENVLNSMRVPIQARSPEPTRIQQARALPGEEGSPMFMPTKNIEPERIERVAIADMMGNIISHAPLANTHYALDERAAQSEANGVDVQPGYVTSKGRFVDRYQAANLASKSGQLDKLDPSHLASVLRRGLDTGDFAEPESFMPTTPAQKEASMDNMNMYVVRHGETTLNATGKTRGWQNPPLNAAGRQEAQDAAKQLEGHGINRLVTSDLARAKETADILGKHLGLPVEVDSGLRPWGFGPKLEGILSVQAAPEIQRLAENPDEQPASSYPTRPAETFNEYRHRLFGTLEKIHAENPDGKTAVVSHYRTMKMLEARTQGHDVDTKTFAQKGKDDPGSIGHLKNGEFQHGLPALNGPTGAPALAEFKDEKTLPAAIAKPNWAGMTATQELNGPHDNEANTKANAELEHELTKSGYPFMEVGGKYKGIEQGKGFLISPIAEPDALSLARKYGQESIITPRGMLYTDGTLAPVVPEGLKVGREAEQQDFYATQLDGPSFSIATDESKRGPANVPVSPTIRRKPNRIIGQPHTSEQARIFDEGLKKAQAKSTNESITFFADWLIQHKLDSLPESELLEMARWWYDHKL